MKEKILLIGAGGHCKVVLDVLFSDKKYQVAGIVAFKELIGSKVLGVPVIGTDQDLPRFFKAGIKNCFIAVGSIGDPKTRVNLYKTAQQAGFVFPNVISSNALISPEAVLGDGNYIAPGVTINAGAKIGCQCIVNTGAIIEHDCVIGDFVHLSPGAILSGGVTVGNLSHIGAGSVVIQSLNIGSQVMVGAGSVVTKDVGKNKTVYGNPCKERKKNA